MAKGYAIADTSKPTDFKVIEFDLKPAEADDVEVAITHCGVCGSDRHTITGGWGPLTVSPCIPGHEIVGIVKSVGENVKEFKVGDRVGVGAQVGSCLNCGPCNEGHEQYCLGDDKGAIIDTYNARWPDGAEAQGGYATAIRAHQQFVFAIPKDLTSENAASMLCAGVTVFSPLLRNQCGPGKEVAVVGLGGLGHYAVLFAVAMGARVTVISHSPRKKDDALKMGAADFIATGEDKEWFKKYGKSKKSFDIIINTASSSALDINALMRTCAVYGALVQCGMPEDAYSIRTQRLADNGVSMQGSHIGSKDDVGKMLKLAAEKQVKPWIEVLPMKECPQAIQRVGDNDVRYRFVLEQDIEPVSA